MAETGEQSNPPSAREGSGSSRGWGVNLAKAWNQASEMVRAAQELIRDKELRSKAAAVVISGAQSQIQGLQNGITRSAGRLGERLQFHNRRLQNILSGLEEQYNTYKRQQQLESSRRQRVDVQLGRALLADVPQEIRCRLWYVLLENPHLAAHIQCQQPGPVPNSQQAADEGGTPTSRTGADTLSPLAGLGGGAGAAAGGAGSDAGGHSGPVPPQPSGGSSSSLAAVLGLGRKSSSSGIAGPGGKQASGGGASTPSNARRDRGAADTASPLGAPLLNRMARADTADGTPGGGHDADEFVLVEKPEGAGSLELPMMAGEFGGGLDYPGQGGAGAGGAGQHGAAAAAHSEAMRLIVTRLEALGPVPLDESGSDPALVAQQAVLQAMMQVPWEVGAGLPTHVDQECRFAMLNEMTAGQEEVDDSIMRDIHRTFPEHPYFGLEAGQRALFKVLKAYSLHDLEVAYCQGMAFMAGVLLMYVPEEMAFRLFCRLMDPEGPNLRRLYLPGLEPLKAELATFELLLTWRFPELAQHLTDYGLPPVLYCSQWLMTLFATPFPPAFCARVIDVLLQDGHDRLLLRICCAVMASLEEGLLRRHDFEALITYLKMEPVQWDLAKQREIMEQGLTSPITDAEIDVARDTVANRAVLAAALAATAARTASGPAGGDSGGAQGGAEGAAGGAEALLEAARSGALVSSGSGLLHGRHSDASGGAIPPKASIEIEVEAALAAAAAAVAAGEAGEAGAHGCSGGGEGAPGDGWEGSSGSVAAMAQLAGVQGQGVTAARTAGDVALIDLDGEGGMQGAGLAGAYGDVYGGAAPLLIDGLGDLRLDCGLGASVGGGAGASTAGALPYDGEYGEMLVDVGLLLPPVEQQQQHQHQQGAAGVGLLGEGSSGPQHGQLRSAGPGSGVGGSGPASGPSSGSVGLRQATAGTGDLLLD